MSTTNRKTHTIGRSLLHVLLLVVCAPSFGAELNVLSAGAVEPGLRPVLAAFERERQHTVTLSFATAPQIRERISSGAARPDVVIAPTAVLDELIANAKVDPAGRVSVGRVGIGVAVRPGGVAPDLSNAETLRRALLASDAVVYNRASTGLYLEGLIKRWGIEEALAPKTVRYADGASVMEHVLHGQGNQIAMGAMTEILLLKPRGLVLVGPLPAEVQNTTRYEAALTAGASAATGTSASRDAACELLALLASTAARRTFDEAGIEAAR